MIENALPEIERLAEAYLRQFNEVFSAKWTKDYTPDSIKAAGDQAAAAALGHRDLLNHEITSICDFYLTAADQDRALLRAAVVDFPNLLKTLHQYIGWCEEHIKAADDRSYLRRALSAASLEDNRVNYKEMYLALGSLYTKCAKVGLQPSIDFVKIAYLSNAQKNKNGMSMRDFLEAFEESAFFKSDIEPKL
jgi:hypothetical protein